MTEPAMPEHKTVRNRLAIPYITPSGVIGFTFRCIQDHNCAVAGHGKYKKPGLEATFYGVMDLFSDSLDIHVTEGEVDAITLSEMCDLPAIGIPGATNWKPAWKEVLSDFRYVFVYCDGDSAGSGLGRKIEKEMGDNRAILLTMPEGEDVNSMYLKYGPERLRNMAKVEGKK